MKTVMIVDYNISQLNELNKMITEKLDYKTIIIESSQEAIEYVVSRYDALPDIILLDLDMPEVSSIEVVKAVKRVSSDIPVIVISSKENNSDAVQATHAGADDFLVRPIAIERLYLTITRCLSYNDLYQEVNKLRRRSQGQVLFKDIACKSDSIKQSIALAKKAASSNILVTIQGEKGVGKEFFARAIHFDSNNTMVNFFIVECKSFLEEFGIDFEDNLEKYLNEAHGTVFFSNIDCLPKAAQIKLLNFLKMHNIENGGLKNLRFMCSTSRNLKDLAINNKFSEELMYQLNVFPILIPPLRSRKEDIEEQITYFMNKYSLSERKIIDSISDTALEFLKSYSWPGNTRELENAVFRAVVICDGNKLEMHHFQQICNSASRDNAQIMSNYEIENYLSLIGSNGHIKQIEELERKIIDFALDFYGGKMSEVARRLGIGRSTLYRKIGDEKHEEQEHETDDNKVA